MKVGIGKLQDEKGFTLIELLVVVAIISLFAGAVTVFFTQRAIPKARWAKMMGDFNEINKAANIFLANEGFYPCDACPGFDASFCSSTRIGRPLELGIICMNKGLVETGLLATWPEPPCKEYTYDWENWGKGIWPSGKGQVARITVRDQSNNGIYYFCIFDSHGSTENKCGGSTGEPIYTLGGTMVNGMTTGSLKCPL